LACPLQRLDRLVVAAETLQGHAPVVVSVLPSLGAAELFGLAESGARIALLALPQQGLAEIHVRRRIVGRQLGRSAQLRLGIAVFLLLLIHPAERRGDRAVGLRLVGHGVDRRASRAGLV